MEKKVYRICLAVAIVFVMVVGIVYYVNYRESESRAKDATLVQNIIWEEGEVV